jgi:predicted membrane-bound dolichyl-phosphate-mannose-protein mannosyltransferase
VLALGLALRVIIAYLLPGSGFRVDLEAFTAWSVDLANNGPIGFYERPFFHDYTPGYLYVLWLVGLVGRALSDAGIEAVGPWTYVDLLKVPPILADLALGWLAWSMTRELGAGPRRAVVAGALVIFNPVTWFDSVVWGQVDSFGVVFLLLAIRELWRDRPERAAILAVIAAIVKPQLGILVPIVAAVTIRRALSPAARMTDETPPTRLATDLPWERRDLGQLRIWTTGLAGFATALVLSLPFGLSIVGLLVEVFRTAGGYPYLSVNAYNPWALFSLDGNGIASNTAWVRDWPGDPPQPYLAFGPVPAVLVGTILLVAAIFAITLRVAQRPDRRTILVAVAALALAVFVLPTRVHERYLFPLIPLGAILVAVSWRWSLPYAVASAATFANMYVVLTYLYPDNPGVRDWLGIGPVIRSYEGVAVIGLSLLAVFVFAASELRTRAHDRLRGEIRGAEPEAEPSPAGRSIAVEPTRGETEGAHAHQAHQPGAPGPGAPGRAIAMPAAGSEVQLAAPPPGPRPALGATWRATTAAGDRPDKPTVVEAGYLGWLRSRLFERPIRPDRSRGLHGERGGRLDRLDVWVVLVLLASVLTLRVWRLAEPYQMHFDEVYHPRTATEFLQHWRYGISHDIYEWTHPHLAKYAMAAGLVLLGNDQVSARSELGVPVRSAAIEPRWDDAATATARTGDRAYVATGDEVRAYDLATRALVASAVVSGASAVAADGARHRLLIGTAGGELLLADTQPLDQLRRGVAAADPAGALGPVSVLQLDGPIREILPSADGSTALVVLGDDQLVAVDPDGGRELGRAAVPGVAQLALAGSGSVLAADSTRIAEPAAAARLLGEITGRAATDIEDRLRTATGTVFLGPVPTGDAKARLDAAVDDGRLAGVAARQVSRIAAAGTDGVTFLDPATGGVVAQLDVDGPAHGLALVTGIDTDRLYVTVDGTDGPALVTVQVAGDSARDGPVRGSQVALPGRGGWVGFDEATLMVHVQGSTPDGSGQTIYVVEPHGNAVFADARLPFEPSSLLMDANQRYPSADRQQILAFGRDGSMASVEVGDHAFAWRLPGVIAGAILAVLIYLLARILFQRRSVAVLAGILVLADGMLFAQSRIGMNDSYVGVLILAAYLLFAAIWNGPWRGWRGFWLVMPVIGVLLGLALASKWVAAYAIAALGVLILTRSALGRLVLIAGLILATTVLGYMAITVPAGEEGGNLLFILLMFALTAVAVVVAVVHPVAWSWEEQRLAVAAPAVVGAGVILAALALGLASTPLVVGPVQVSAIELSFGLFVLSGLVHAAFVVAGRRGIGPMAVPPRPDDPRALLEAPAPASVGWVRPGALFGLPVMWMGACLVLVPLVVYVISYVPWAFVDSHQLWPGWPAGHTGQTLVSLTEQMYRYHNTLTAAHPASSPWWAWPFDLKPVWFYQESFAGGTAAAIYDAGNLAAWWLSVPALMFVAWQAFRRRSLALALIAIGFAFQWIAWARIDRAAFQYHYYTSLPFVLLALAYFLAELWHGASSRTWLLARLTAAAAIVAPMAMWLLHRPLCGFVRVEDVYPGSQSCPTLIPDFLLTGRALAIAVVVGIGVLAVLRQFTALDRPESEAPPQRGWLRTLLPLLVTAVVTMVAQIIVSSVVPETPLLTLTGVPVEPIAVVAILPLLGLAAVVATARDARRFVAGAVVAVVTWFLLAYPNLSALPLPYAMVNSYQGVLPTYVFAFQFPVSTVDRNVAGPSLLSTGPALLLISLTITCVVLAYSAWSWRVALAARRGSPFRIRLGRWPGGQIRG